MNRTDTMIFPIRNMSRRRILGLIVCLLLTLLSGQTSTMRSQPRFALHIGFGGSGKQLVSLNAELRLLKFDSLSIVQSLRVSTGYGLQLQNANFLPVEIRTVFFHGTHHIDLYGGCSFQTVWVKDGYEQTRHLAYSALNPTFGAGYRFEGQQGGFSGRFCLGGFYSIGGAEMLPIVTFSIGYAF